MSEGEDLEEKKLLGSGGYAFAKLTEQEELRASLGVPQIFLGNVGRLNDFDFVVEITGDYTGTLTGRGASHERKSHTH